MTSTDDGLPLMGPGGGDVALMRKQIAAAREIVDNDQRAVRLYFLGRGLLDCDDPTTAEEAAIVLAEAMNAGSAHASLDLGQLLLAQATHESEVQAALGFIERAARMDLHEAQLLLGRILLESPATAEVGRAWLNRANESVVTSKREE